MPIIRKKLDPNTVYPDDLRYNENTDTVQTNVNGQWVDNPEADPRNQTTYPPRNTANPRCDGARSVADALSNQIMEILTAIDNASTAYTIAGLILGLLAFGPFGIFIGIALFLADQMLAAGSTAIEAALPPSAFDTLTCILYCRMDANGRLKTGQLPATMGDVDAQIGGFGAIILNGFLSLAGEGGINNLASLGTSSGSCGGCPCNIECISEEAVIFGTVVNQTSTYIDIQSELATYNGLTRQWAIYGSLTNDFCCMMCQWQVQAGAISSGNLFDCAGAINNGLPGTKRRAEFYHNTTPFIIRYRFD